MALILDGRPLAAALKQELQVAVAALARKPVLAVVQVGDDSGALWYVRSIKRAAEGVGIQFRHVHLPPDATQAMVEASVGRLSRDAEISGVIIQMPLPVGLRADAVVAALDPRKDVDGLHPLNAGRLAQGSAGLIPNTPAGGMALLRHYGLPIRGQHAVVVGRSNVVGKPMALLLLAEDATVTVCHSRTRDLGAVVKQADLVVVAVGKAGMVTGAMLKPGTTVIDFGINDHEGGVVGDVEWDSALAVAGAITPVPGGTGPVTNMMLLKNTLTAQQLLTGQPDEQAI
ncbi:MAG: bifunctional 5,10-methylenetetrahydrofolate dehydrogenase/5,10-methenyltetrahydrofolate cyclohydrolase [Herpetosiphon sp.]